MTIKGAKKYIYNKDVNLDDQNNKLINSDILKIKLKKISTILKNIKKDG